MARDKEIEDFKNMFNMKSLQVSFDRLLDDIQDFGHTRKPDRRNRQEGTE